MGAIILIAALKGYKRGFISELAGALALFASLLVPFWYNGFADFWIRAYMHLGPGSAHVVGMLFVGLGTYAAIMIIAWALGRVAKLPFLGLGNALAGAAVGVLKSAVFLWFVLFIALFFPLSPDLRADLHHSRLVAVFVQPDQRIDDAISAALPWFARPFARPLLNRHRV